MAKLNTSPAQMLKGHGPELNYSGAILRRTEPGAGSRLQGFYKLDWKLSHLILLILTFPRPRNPIFFYDPFHSVCVNIFLI